MVGRENEIENLTIYVLQAIVIALIFPSNILTYRARVFNMKVLKQVKRNKNAVTFSKGYKRYVHHLNLIFWLWPPYNRLTYPEYLILRRREGPKANLWALYFKILAITFLSTTQLYRITTAERF
jgi:hypothetical protein